MYERTAWGSLYIRLDISQCGIFVHSERTEIINALSQTINYDQTVHSDVTVGMATYLLMVEQKRIGAEM